MGTIAQLFETGEQVALKGHFQNLVMLARVDGNVDESERALLARIANRLSLSDDQVKSICDDTHSYPSVPPVSKEERYDRLIQLIQMILVDGEVESSESRLIEKYSIALGFVEAESAQIASEIITELKAGKSREDILSSLM
jgi:uncharacterized tellurite resistance protein B-like protein